MYWVAFITGFLGSMHCIGMCGPLALAVPIPHGKRCAGLTLYNIGRTLSYAALGILFGALGLAVSLSGFQQVLSVSMGIVFLLAVVLPAVSTKAEKLIYGSAPVKRLKKEIGAQFRSRTYVAAFSVGVLNGLLPCGLVYFAIAGSAATGHFLTGGLYMVAFSLGTMPAMMSVGIVRRWFPNGFNFKVSAALGFFLALILIYRGVALEIPRLTGILETVGLGKITSCGN
ncbi:MAG: sulfite exporter TauE/SafE family protein [Cyclobacteriaceae bacterium]